MHKEDKNLKITPFY